MDKPKPTFRDLWQLYALCALAVIMILIALISGCTEVRPERIQIEGQLYIQEPATKAPPLAGLPDLGEH